MRAATIASRMANQRFSFAASFTDIDSDGDPDLYVANDFGRNNLYRNDRDKNGDSTFTDVAKEAAVEDISAGMSVSWADVDGDGDRDLYVSNMWSSAGNRLAYQRNFQSDADETARAEFGGGIVGMGSSACRRKECHGYGRAAHHEKSFLRRRWAP